jgi:hypothetical protein
MRNLFKINFMIIICSSGFNLNSQTIEEVGSWANNPNFSIEYFGNRLYVGDADNSANILDVSAVGNPSYVENANFSTDWPMSFEVSGNYCFVGGSGFFGGNAMFAVLDITNPDAPLILHESTFFTGVVTEIKIKNNIAYVLTGAPKIYAVDISSPSSPTILGSLDLGVIGTDGANGLELSEDGTKAFVGTGSWMNSGLGIKTISITNPANMSVLSEVSGNYTYLSYDEIGDRLFASKMEGGFDVFSVSATNTITPLFQVADASGAYTKRLIYKQGKLFVITDAKLNVYSISTSSANLNLSVPFDNQVNDIAIKDISTIFVSSVNAVTEFAIDWNAPAGLLESELQNTSIKAFPNPCADKLTIDLNQDITNIKLMNTLGQEVKGFESSVNGHFQLELDLHSVAEGAYLLQLQTNSDLKVVPVVIAR